VENGQRRPSLKASSFAGAASTVASVAMVDKSADNMVRQGVSPCHEFVLIAYNEELAMRIKV